MTNVVLVGTLDTKGVEYGWLRERLLRAGVEVVLVDTGIMGEPRCPPTSHVTRWPGQRERNCRNCARPPTGVRP